MYSLEYLFNTRTMMVDERDSQTSLLGNQESLDFVGDETMDRF